MNVFQWLSELTGLDILTIAAIWQLTIIAIFILFAMRIGDVRTIDDFIPKDGQR